MQWESAYGDLFVPLHGTIWHIPREPEHPSARHYLAKSNLGVSSWGHVQVVVMLHATMSSITLGYEDILSTIDM